MLIKNVVMLNIKGARSFLWFIKSDANQYRIIPVIFEQSVKNYIRSGVDDWRLKFSLLERIRDC